MKTEVTGAAEAKDAAAVANEATEKLRQYIHQRSESNKNMSASIEQFRRHIGQLNAQIRQRDDVIEKAQQERNRLSSELEEMGRLAETVKGQHAGEIQTLKQSISNLSDKIDAMEAEKATLNEAKAKLEADLEAAQTRIAELEKSLVTIQEEADNKVARVMAAAERGKRTMKIEHDEAIEKLQAQLRERNQKNNKLEVSNKSLREENNNLAELTTNLQHMIDTLFENEIAVSPSYAIDPEAEPDMVRNFSMPASGGGVVQEQVKQDMFREASRATSVVPMKAQG